MFNSISESLLLNGNQIYRKFSFFSLLSHHFILMEISQMPTYEYKCLKCNYLFEQFQKITDDPVTECPNCKGKVKRLISGGAGPIFKGSGFYQTDYKNTSKRPSTKETESPKIETKKTDSTGKKE